MKLPIESQRALLKETLKTENVELTGDVPQSLDNDIPDIVENLVNGAVDVFLDSFPGVSQLLGPLIKGGIRWLKNIFGEHKVYIPNMPPVITCPATRTVLADKGRNTAVVTWQEPLGYDAEDGTITKVTRTGKAPGSQFSGELTVKYEVADSKGRTDFCMFAITVKVINCPPIPLEMHRTNTCPSHTRYGDNCTFSCATGYTMDGQPTLSCLRSGQYNLQAPTCKINTCKDPKLPTGGEKWICSNSNKYNSVCNIKCRTGFRNVDNKDRAPWNQASITCQADGQWTRMPVCQDVSAPEITNCPGYRLSYADRGKRTTKVYWSDIQAKDANGGAVTVTRIEGPDSGSVFTEGAQQVSYVAVDSAGLNDTCTFFVNVQVLFCGVPVMTDPKVNVDCQNKFSYGSACTLSCLQGVTLQGAQRISCEKYGDDMKWDYPGGQPTCLEKKCTTLPDPPNAHFSCFTLNGGTKMCNMKCNDGFIPAQSHDRQRDTSCSPATGVWTNTDYPGCVQERAATSLKKKILMIWRAPCAPADDVTDVTNVTSTMRTVLQRSSFFDTCPNCTVVDVRSTCRARPSSNMVGLRWSIVTDTDPDKPSAVTMSKVDGVAIAQKAYLETHFKTLPMIGVDGAFQWRDAGETAGCDSRYVPSPGSLACAACGVGYQTNGNGGCERCPVNTFQDDSGDGSCIQCPVGTQTLGNGKRASRDCKSPCPAGSDSPSGLTPCRDCSIGEYNELQGQTHCTKCKPGQYTPAPGSQLASDCYDPASKVINFFCTDVGSDSASCSWLPPAQFNGQLMGYEIDFRERTKYATQTIQIPSKQVESYTIRNLTPETDYVFTIYAMNQNGRGVKNTINLTTKTAVTTTEQPTTTEEPTTTAQTTTPGQTACPAGYSSFNGHNTPVPCTPCGKGFYQTAAGQKDCLPCTAGLTTWYTGTDSIDKCVDNSWTTPSTTTTTTTTPSPTTNTPHGAPCLAGYASSTGFEPGCRKCGVYQEPDAERKSCTWCPYTPSTGFQCSAQ